MAYETGGHDYRTEDEKGKMTTMVGGLCNKETKQKHWSFWACTPGDQAQVESWLKRQCLVDKVFMAFGDGIPVAVTGGDTCHVYAIRGTHPALSEAAMPGLVSSGPPEIWISCLDDCTHWTFVDCIDMSRSGRDPEDHPRRPTSGRIGHSITGIERAIGYSLPRHAKIYIDTDYTKEHDDD